MHCQKGLIPSIVRGQGDYVPVHVTFKLQLFKDFYYNHAARVFRDYCILSLRDFKISLLQVTLSL